MVTRRRGHDCRRREYWRSNCYSPTVILLWSLDVADPSTAMILIEIARPLKGTKRMNLLLRGNMPTRIQLKAWSICAQLGLVIIVGVLNAETSQSATYYVARTGSNSNSCSQAQSVSTPKLTIN